VRRWLHPWSRYHRTAASPAPHSNRRLTAAHRSNTHAHRRAQTCARTKPTRGWGLTTPELTWASGCRTEVERGHRTGESACSVFSSFRTVETDFGDGCGESRRHMPAACRQVIGGWEAKPPVRESIIVTDASLLAGAEVDILASKTDRHRLLTSPPKRRRECDVASNACHGQTWLRLRRRKSALMRFSFWVISHSLHSLSRSTARGRGT
jgi:hypothetical protein